MAKTDRTILISNDQQFGQVADPNKLEAQITHAFEKIDENDDEFIEFKTATELPTPSQSVTTDKLRDGNVTEPKLADDSVSRRTIATGAVGKDELDPTLWEQTASKAKFNEIDEQLADIAINVKNFGAKGDGVTDDTASIQAALDHAGTLYKQGTLSGYTLTYRSRVVVLFPNGTYKTTALLNVPKGVSLQCADQSIMSASPGNKTIKCFVFTDTAWRCDVQGFVFVGYATAIEATTGNLDVSKMTFTNLNFHACGVGIDTVSYTSSRSTVLTIKDCISYKTDYFVKAYCDMTTIEESWITHSGWEGAAIYNDSRLYLKNCLFVPNGGTDPRWVDNYSSAGEHGLHIDGCRFGGEAGGGIPIVFNYATAITSQSNYMAKHIVIENSQLSVIGTNRDAVVVLFAMPNRIAIKNCYGYTNLVRGLITCDSSFDVTTVAYSPYIGIELDDSATYNPTYPLMDTSLLRFLKGFKNQQDMFQTTYLGSGARGQIPAVATATAGQAKITFDLDQGTGANVKQLGASFIVVTTAGATGGDSGYKAVTTSIVHCVGGWGTTNQKRLSFSKLYGTAGGNGFADTADIISIFWGTGDTGSTDQNKTDTNTKVTIVFNSKGSIGAAAATIVPLLGFSQ